MLLRLLILGACLVSANAHALFVSINTSALAGMDARLEINLLDGDDDPLNPGTPGNPGNNTATAFGQTITDPDQILYDFLAGGTLNFLLNYTKNFSGGDPDLLIINLLDAGTNFSLSDTDLDALEAPVPYQDALLVCRLDTAECLLPTASDPLVTVFVPEPSTMSLLALIPGFVALRRCREKRSPQS